VQQTKFPLKPVNFVLIQVQDTGCKIPAKVTIVLPLS